MVSLDKDVRTADESYLIVEIDSIKFAVQLAQIDRVEEFDTEFQNKTEIEFCIGNYREQNEDILILNLKKYLRCFNEEFIITLQSRILFLRYSEKTIEKFDVIKVGVGVDAIVNMYHTVALDKIRKTERFGTEELQCFQIDSSVEINSKIYPILDLTKVLDLT